MTWHGFKFKILTKLINRQLFWNFKLKYNYLNFLFAKLNEKTKTIFNVKSWWCNMSACQNLNYELPAKPS